MNKPYEFTRTELKDASIAGSIGETKQVVYDAQKKLLEHIYRGATKKITYTREPSGESYYAISEFDMHELLGDFGIS